MSDRNPYKQILGNFYGEISKKLPPDQMHQFLEYTIMHCQNLMGIGTGSDPNSSGEQIVFDLLKRKVRDGQSLCIFDVGSNKGQYLFQINRYLAGIPYQIHAFEPCYHTFKMLLHNFEDTPNVHFNNLGLGKRKEKAVLYYDEIGSGLASLYNRRLEHYGIRFGHKETVHIETLDGYCQENDIHRIDLLKLDVEGHELDVLKGGKEMFRENNIEMITFEFGGCNIDSRTYFQDFYYFFKENGMTCMYRITPPGYLVPIHQYKELDEQFRTTNYLVLHNRVI